MSILYCNTENKESTVGPSRITTSKTTFSQLLLILLTFLLLLLLLIVTSPIRPRTSIRSLTLGPRTGRLGCRVKIVALWEGRHVLVGRWVVRQDGAVGGVVARHRVPGRLARVQAAHLALRAETGGRHVGELLQARLARVVEAGGGVV